jgi:S1-C subfamily serine protease
MTLASKVMAMAILAGCSPCFVAVQASGLTPAEVYRRVVVSTLSIKVRTTSGDRFVGAAFLVGDSSRAATAWHLIRDAEEIYGTYSDGTTAQIREVIAHHETHDLALLQVAPTSREPLHLQLETPPIASRLYAIGSPRGYSFSISDGLLSQIQQIDGFPQYQLTCPFSPGNSGGPVVNEEGQVVGISSWSKIGAQNLNFAIPSPLLANLVSGSNSGAAPKASVSDTDACTARVADPAAISTQLPRSPKPEEVGLQGLQEFLSDFAGKTVRITVSADDQTRSLQYHVPVVPSLVPVVGTDPEPGRPIQVPSRRIAEAESASSGLAQAPE